MDICIPNILTALLEDNVSNLMQNVGLAFLTIQISLAIAVFTDVLQKREDKDIKFAKLDLHVILDEVFKIKYVLFYIVLIYAPLFFWGCSPWYCRLIELILSIAGIILLVKTIIDIYRWTKGDAFMYRFSYLSKLKNNNDMVIVWHSVWQTENINFRDEKRFFKIFSSKVDELLQ